MADEARRVAAEAREDVWAAIDDGVCIADETALIGVADLADDEAIRMQQVALEAAAAYVALLHPPGPGSQTAEGGAA